MGNLNFGYKPMHPGRLLKEEIEFRGISQRKIASQLGMSYVTLNGILNERYPLTTTTAMMFEAALGIPAYLLAGMQTDYNLQVANQDKKLLDRLAEIRRVASML